MTSWLVDTGPLVAYLDSRDRFHGAVVGCLDGFSGQLLTTSAVITEAMHFVSMSSRGPSLLAELVMTSGTKVHDLTHPEALLEAAALMEKYTDTPMDFADATLTLLAERLDILDILTLDRRGFSAYRTRDRGAFQLVLDVLPNRDR